MITADDLRSLLGTGDDPYLDVVVTQAVALVESYAAEVNLAAEVPEVILDRARLDVAADMWSRRTATNGVAQFGADDLGAVQAVRIRNDLLTVARPTLAPWVKGGIA